MKKVVLLTGLFVVLSVLFVAQLRSEAGQVILLYLATGSLGYWVGHVVPGRPPSTYILLGSSLGLVEWFAFVMYRIVLYANVVDPIPYFAWFVRFGVGVALAFIGVALLGDSVARGKASISLTVIASVISLIGTILGLAFG